MSYVSIRAEKVTKRFHLGVRSRYGTLRDEIVTRATAPFRRSAATTEVTALNEVSFAIRPGEVVGLIGRNGAGKSTLLKVLSRITAPTSGRVELRGRVGSLLEVGTGFHPELTGRDNVYLSGSILGMKRAAIKKRFDEIVAFSEVEKFLDTPVKRFSSGMVVRLAFAVAAHLDAELLIVDEVLAVSDARFQKKCLNTLQDQAHRGRTVLFVSHNMQTCARLCSRLIYLEQGRVAADGVPAEIAAQYLRNETGTSAARLWPENAAAPGSSIVRLRSCKVRGEDGRVAEVHDQRKAIALELEFEVLEAGSQLTPQFSVLNEEGLCLFTTRDQDPEWRNQPRPKGRFTTTAWIPSQLLNEGRYSVQVEVQTLEPPRLHARERDVLVFQVVDSLTGDPARGDFAGKVPGLFRPTLKWTTEHRAA